MLETLFKYWFWFLATAQSLVTMWFLYGFLDLENKPSIFTWTDYDGLFLFACITVVTWGIGFLLAWLIEKKA